MGTKKPTLIIRCSQFFFKKSDLKFGLVATAVFSGYLAFLSFVGKSFEVDGGKVKSLGTTFGFGVRDVTQFFTERSDEMITSYINFNQIWDFTFAIIYGFMYIIWLSVIYKPYKNRIWVLNLIPLIQVIFDWIENFCLASIAKAYLADGSISASNVTLASNSSSIKWVFSVLVYLLIVYGIGLRLVKTIKNKKRN